MKQTNPLQWVAEPFESHSTFELKKMFGGELLCLHHRQMIFLIAKEEPWNGVLLCTSREHHASLLESFPQLAPHSVLGKWLYISQSNPNFEAIVEKITKLSMRDDPRIGVEPKAKKSKKRSKTKKRAKAKKRS